MSSSSVNSFALACSMLAACGSSTAAVAPTPPPSSVERTSPPEHVVPALDSAPTPPAATAPAPSKECVNRERAVHNANDGDQSHKTDLDAAIAHYEAAVTLDPVNHFLYWKLGHAYEKRAEWGKAASTYNRAAIIAPQYAHYWGRMGHAWWRLGEQNEPDAYAAAEIPLLRCLHADPARADCHFWLGLVEARLSNDVAATVHLTRAIELDPKFGAYYPPLVAAYSRLGNPAYALAVAREGLRFLDSHLRNAPALYALEHFVAAAARKRGDKSAARTAATNAQELATAAGLDLPHFDLECGCPQTPAVISRNAKRRAPAAAPPAAAPPAAAVPVGPPLTGYTGYDPACPPQGGPYVPSVPYSEPGVNLPTPVHVETGSQKLPP